MVSLIVITYTFWIRRYVSEYFLVGPHLYKLRTLDHIVTLWLIYDIQGSAISCTLWFFIFYLAEVRSLTECFRLFDLIHTLTTDHETVTRITKEVCPLYNFNVRTSPAWFLEHTLIHASIFCHRLLRILLLRMLFIWSCGQLQRYVYVYIQGRSHILPYIIGESISNYRFWSYPFASPQIFFSSYLPLKIFFS